MTGSSYDPDVAPPSDILGSVLGALGRSADVGRRSMEDILRSVAEAASRTLQVARVNVWLYDVERTRVRCIEAYDARTGAHTNGEELLASDYPRYFAALDRLRNIAALNAEHDSRTQELSDYLARHGVTTMLDVPILNSGRVAGVVCHEHVGSPRTFSSTDRLFAGSIGDLLALVLEANERLAVENTNARLAERISRMERVESLGWLAGSIAHDFRNLLFVMSANAELLVEQLGPTGDSTETALEIKQTAQRAAELCEQLLTYSGQRELVAQRVNLGDLAEEITRLLRPRVPEGATLRAQTGGELLVLGDPTQLRQVLLNLVLNGLDALAPGRGSVIVRVAAEQPARADCSDGYDFRRSEGAMVLLEVTDDGSGMTSETRRRLFEPFFTTKSAGHGFGLSAALGIVRTHCGLLHVETRTGGGTRIRVWLPADPGATVDSASKSL
jgi:two-component system, cell cycle sensor histidine kinase and response regulator CckA